MLCYKDRTFCSYPDCENKCGHKITRDQIREAVSMGMFISWADFCGEEADLVKTKEEE